MNKAFGRKKLLTDISSNTIQAFTTQIFGLLIFYITSKYLTKNDFGELNWATAICSTVIAISSLGLDLVFVKRVASGQNVLVISGIHLFHTIIAALILSLAALGINVFIPSFTSAHPIFFYIFFYLAVANIANSFKLCLNGLEAYKQLAVLALCINVVKFLSIVLLYYFGIFNMGNVIYAYIATSIVELIMGYYFLGRKLETHIKPILRKHDYKHFILESLPLLGVVLFDSALARIDWILLGAISTVSKTAEYSFAYKIFEISKLPVLIIAPVLLTRFSKIFSGDSVISDRHKSQINLFLKLELFFVMLIPIVLICSWTPLIDYLTNNKYGAVNETNFKILALCIPLVCIINFLWTIGFVQGQLKAIMFITIASSGLNVIANAFLIPLYDSLGASIAFLFSTLVQLVLYVKYIRQNQVRLDLKSCLIAFTNALIGVLVGNIVSNNFIVAAFISLLLFTALSFITKQISVNQVKQALQG